MGDIQVLNLNMKIIPLIIGRKCSFGEGDFLCICGKRLAFSEHMKYNSRVHIET